MREKREHAPCSLFIFTCTWRSTLQPVLGSLRLLATPLRVERVAHCLSEPIEAGPSREVLLSARSDTIGGVMRAFGYIRVSESSEDGVSLDVQRARTSLLHSQQGRLTRCHSTGAEASSTILY